MSGMKDGGPIHPIAAVRDADGCGIMEGWNGMSLRDWFAGQALMGLMADANFDALKERVASLSYELADAMLEAREVRS